jgi:3-oxoacyl-[acyl-carrier protein] reductase
MLDRARPEVPQPAGTTGSIVNISSTGAKRGAFGQANYSAAKSGLFGLTMTGAVEWAKYGIRCNSVGFGTVNTAMTEVLRSEKYAAQTLARIPLGRYAEPHEAANMVAFLLSNAAVYITGENMTVSGGLHMQP